jgi:hypothetical protein
MSRLDDELKTLRTKLAELEEQKRIEPEVKADPLKTLDMIVTNTKRSGENHYEKKRWQEYHQAVGKTVYLEPIIEALKQIQERLDALEQK